MRYGSVCSGIEAASVAWESLGWEAQWYSEIEHFPSAVLAHRFPTVPNLGDMTLIQETQTFNDTTIDLLVGGTPCQSFSVAGLRKGLTDPRGNLMLTFLALAERKKPRWLVWENVPGVLSSNGGRDFATFLTALGDIGYGFAYRILDAQYFGVAQRRRRVFVVAYLGDWRPCASVLFEQDCLSGNSKESKQKRKTTSSNAEGGSGGGGIPRVSGSLDTQCGGGKLTHQSVNNGHLVPAWWNGEQTAATLTKQNANGAQRMPDKDNFGAVLEPKTHAFKVRGGSEDNTGEQGGTPGKKAGKGYLGQDEKAFTIGTTQDQQIAQPIAVDCYNQTINHKTNQTIGSSASDVNHYGAVLQPTIIDRAAFNQGANAQYDIKIEQGETMSSLVAKGPHGVATQNIAPTLTASNDPSRSPQSSEVTNQIKAVYQASMAIRRLTPRECERLQGFPDDWTLIPYRNKTAEQCPDGPRYKACGNSMAVPVMRWIGQRIEMVEKLIADQ
jgi:DNA (cytosine-5)-methyltransferase 1